MTDAIDHVASACRMSRETILSNRRDMRTCRARWIAMKLLRKQGLSLEGIGIVTNRHHTTVLSGIRIADQLLVDDPDFIAFARAVELI